MLRFSWAWGGVLALVLAGALSAQPNRSNAGPQSAGLEPTQPLTVDYGTLYGYYARWLCVPPDATAEELARAFLVWKVLLGWLK